MTSFPASSSRPLSNAGVPRGVPSVERLEACQRGTAVGPMPWIVAYDGQNPVEYAEAVAKMGTEESTGDAKLVQYLLNGLSSLGRYPAASHHPSQSPNSRNQAFLDTHGIRHTPNPNPVMFGVTLPPSFDLARNCAEHGNRRHPCQGVVNINPPPAEVTPDEQARH
jgi:hypothetical protein